MLDELTHISWLTIAGVAALGLGLVYWANVRRSRNLFTAGAAAMAVACVLLAARLLIVTDRARCENRTVAIVAAASRADWTALGLLLDEHTVVHTVGTESVAGRRNIVAVVQDRSAAIGLKGVLVRGLESKQNQTLITVDLEAASTQDATEGNPLTSGWQFDYEQTGRDWTLDTITLIRLGNEPAQGIANYH